ncbi:MAG: PAS domain-containing protein [Sporomusaceae bacterium]|nr:PAS domain-containing protein [Sporomusaceae bacterium]
MDSLNRANFAPKLTKIFALVVSFVGILGSSCILLSLATDAAGIFITFFLTLAAMFMVVISLYFMHLVKIELHFINGKLIWYESILDSIPFPLSITDMNMKWTFINRAVEEFLGVKRANVIGAPCSTWNANICNTPDCGIMCLRNNKQTTFFQQKGLTFQVDVHYLFNETDKRIGHIEIVQDISKILEADERIRIIFDSTPLSCVLWNHKFETIDCNQEAFKLFGLPNKTEFMEKFLQLSPAYQPSGALSADLINEIFAKVLQEGYLRLEWLHQNIEGEPIPTEITLVRAKYKENFIVAAYTKDLREYKTMLQEMSRIETIEENSKAKSLLLSKMKREIRASLNNILIITQAQPETSAAEKEAAFAKIDSFANSILRTINDTPEFTGTETDRLEVNTNRHHLN